MTALAGDHSNRLAKITAGSASDHGASPAAMPRRFPSRTDDGRGVYQREHSRARDNRGQPEIDSREIVLLHDFDHARHGGPPVALHVRSAEERARSASGAAQEQAELDVIHNGQTQRFVTAARAIGGVRTRLKAPMPRYARGRSRFTPISSSPGFPETPIHAWALIVSAAKPGVNVT